MPDGEASGLGGEFSVSVSMPAEEDVTGEEEESDEQEESGHTDDDEDVDDINHTSLTKEAVPPNTPTQRTQREDIWKHVRRIGNHDVPDRGMNAECTNVCVYRLNNGDDGEKSFCNTPLKLFRSSKGKEAGWSTSAADDGGGYTRRLEC